MRVFRTLLLCSAALALAGCDDEGDVILAPNPPLAFTRFVNAVPDTSGQDWRFIDQIDYSPPAFNLQFRGFTPYQQTAVGARPLRVFPTSSNIDVTSTRLVDTTLTFEAGRYYTIVHVGLADDGSNHIVLVQDDDPTDLGDDEVAIRAMHVVAGIGNIDVHAEATTSSPISGSPTFANVAYQSTTDYTQLAVGSLALHAVPAGEVTPTMAVAEAPEGDPGDPDDNLSPVGGSTMPGSAILGIFMPASVAGTSAPQDPGFEAPAWVYIIDRHPR